MRISEQALEALMALALVVLVTLSLWQTGPVRAPSEGQYLPMLVVASAVR